MCLKLRGKSNQTIFSCIYLPMWLQHSDCEFRMTRLSEYCSKNHQSKKPISVESVCPEARQGLPCPQQSPRSRGGAGAGSVAGRRCCCGGRAAGAGRSFPGLRAEYGRLNPLRKRPLESKDGKMFLFWKKADFKAVSKLVLWVMPATVGQELWFIFWSFLQDWFLSWMMLPWLRMSQLWGRRDGNIHTAVPTTFCLENNRYFYLNKIIVKKI